MEINWEEERKEFAVGWKKRDNNSKELEKKRKVDCEKLKRKKQTHTHTNRNRTEGQVKEKLSDSTSILYM